MSEDENKPIGMNERLKLIEDKIDAALPKTKEGKQKPFKMKWGMRRQLKILAKKNKILVFFLKTNRALETKICEIKDGMIHIGDYFYHVGTDFIFLYNGLTPSIVLPEWSLKPIGTKDYYDAVKNKEATVEAQNVIIRRIELAKMEQGEKKKMSFKMILIILGILAVVAWVLFYGRKGG